jgi:hypothetical protein
MITRNDVINWMEEFKSGWIGKKKDNVLKLFEKTEKYYERPFKPGTTKEEIRVYWNDIDALDDISFDYEIYAIENNIACIHWDNKYTYQNQSYHLDGIYTIKFNETKECIEFRQWWFMEQ